MVTSGGRVGSRVGRHAAQPRVLARGAPWIRALRPRARRRAAGRGHHPRLICTHPSLRAASSRGRARGRAHAAGTGRPAARDGCSKTTSRTLVTAEPGSCAGALARRRPRAAPDRRRRRRPGRGAVRPELHGDPAPPGPGQPPLAPRADVARRARGARGRGAVGARGRGLRALAGRTKDVRVIPPGVDLDAFTPDPDARASDPTIICAADLGEPRKRVGLLVEAFARVRRERPDRAADPQPAARGRRRPPGPGSSCATSTTARRSPPPTARRTWRRCRAWGRRSASSRWRHGMRDAGRGLQPRGAARGRRLRAHRRALRRRRPRARWRARCSRAWSSATYAGTAKRLPPRAEQFSSDRTTDRYLALYREVL